MGGNHPLRLASLRLAGGFLVCFSFVFREGTPKNRLQLPAYPQNFFQSFFCVLIGSKLQRNITSIQLQLYVHFHNVKGS